MTPGTTTLLAMIKTKSQAALLVSHLVNTASSQLHTYMDNEL